ncbi:MAG: hypothetical protein ACI9KE_006313, partial [Polyangiales bacterium]
DGTNVSSHTPVEALGITDAIRLGEGGGGTGVSSVNTCAVRESGDATCWGGCWQGACGTGEPIIRAVPARVVGL